jgi:hypothetical protein
MKQLDRLLAINKLESDPVLCVVDLDFSSSCDIKHQHSLICDNRSTLRNNHHTATQSSQTINTTICQILPTQTLSLQPLRQAQAQWRLATKVHAQATAAHTQTVATTTQETHAKPDHHAATVAPRATGPLTPPAAVAEAAPTPLTGPLIATPDRLAHVHLPARPTTTLHVNALLRALLAAQAQTHPTLVSPASLKRLLQQSIPMRMRRLR